MTYARQPARLGLCDQLALYTSRMVFKILGIGSSGYRPLTFLLATFAIVVWALTGPVFHYSDTWQLVINTGTSLITFLMVFLIQNSQNRDTLALHVKLDEIILALENA